MIQQKYTILIDNGVNDSRISSDLKTLLVELVLKKKKNAKVLYYYWRQMPLVFVLVIDNDVRISSSPYTKNNNAVCSSAFVFFLHAYRHLQKERRKETNTYNYYYY